MCLDQKHILERLMHAADLTVEPVPGKPLIEIMDNRKVLIENHFGVSEYSLTQIGVIVHFGKIQISGNNLMLAQMCKERLVITGTIDRVELLKG